VLLSPSSIICYGQG